MNRMNRHTALLLAFAATVASLPAPAVAYGVATYGDSLKGNIIRWGTPNISYYLDEAGTKGLTAAQAQQCMKDSFAGWEQSANSQGTVCTSLHFTYAGTTTVKKVLPLSTSYNIYEDGKNQLVWINSGWTFGDQVLGVTMVNGSWSWSGTITESDIAFNGQNYNWNVTGDVGYWNNDMDCRSVAIHEIGHLFGLQHVLSGASYTDPPTMNPAVDPEGKSASLSLDDQLGACFLYPVNDYYRCSKTSECPKVVGHDGNQEIEVGQIYCQDTYCQGGGGLAPNTTELGGVCTKVTDCVVGLGCWTLSSGVDMCSRTCDTAADDCPAGYHCEVPAGTGVTQSICVPGTKKKVVGDACSTAYECTTNFCQPQPDKPVTTTCRLACTSGGTACPVGEACWSSAYSSVGGCYPEAMVPKVKLKLGAECTAQGECESGLCYAAPDDVARCLKTCVVASPVCYTGYRCIDMGNGDGACVPGDGKKVAGVECAANDECSSGWCVTLVTDGKSWCRKSCDLASWVCDTGNSCVSFGSTDFGVCMPSEGKGAAGEACAANADCISTMCRDFGDGGRLCTQNCVAGACPNDWHCVVGDPWGDLCAPAGFDPLTPGDEGTPQEDRGTTVDEDVPGTAQDFGQEDAGWVPPQPLASKKGCTAGAVPGTAPVLQLLLALGALIARRRRS